MNIISYRITLMEPLLATRIDGDPNSAVSHPYLPGSMVRGAAVRAYLQSANQPMLDAGSEDVQRLFFDGRTRYLNAFPITPTGQRMLPTPHSWFTVKSEDDPVYDFAQKVRLQVDGQTKQFSAAATNSRPFCWIDDENVHFRAPTRRVNVHTQRNRSKGRACEGAGAVFQYDALDVGEQFAGLVLVDGQSDADLVRSLLSRISVLGGSSNSGYGRVRIDVSKPIDLEQGNWRETPGRVPTIASGQPFVVTLLSDTLVRSKETGQYSLGLKPALEDALGVELQNVSSPEDAELDEEQRGARRIQEVGGFNRTWGLPLPQSQAVSAGSVFIFKAVQSIESTAIARAEWQGLGERRSEGYGRLAFDWQTDSELQVVNPHATRSLSDPPVLNGSAKEMAETIVQRLIRRNLDAALRKRVNNLKIQHAPPNAQLSRLRVIAREALQSGDVARLGKFMQGVGARRSARDSFERAHISGKRFSRWLEDHLDDPALVWQELGVSSLEMGLGSNVRLSVKGNETLAREYTIRLIDGVLAKAAQERREQEENDR